MASFTTPSSRGVVAVATAALLVASSSAFAPAQRAFSRGKNRWNDTRQRTTVTMCHGTVDAQMRIRSPISTTSKLVPVVRGCWKHHLLSNRPDRGIGRRIVIDVDKYYRGLSCFHGQRLAFYFVSLPYISQPLFTSRLSVSSCCFGG